MELSRQADYAVRTMVELAKASPGRYFHTEDIARGQNIPENYLPSIIRALARAGLIRTMRGSQGGVSLSRLPSQINLLEVVEAVEGQILLNRCLIRPGECFNEGQACRLHQFWHKMTADLEERLRSVNFQELAAADRII